MVRLPPNQRSHVRCMWMGCRVSCRSHGKPCRTRSCRCCLRGYSRQLSYRNARALRSLSAIPEVKAVWDPTDLSAIHPNRLADLLRSYTRQTILSSHFWSGKASSFGVSSCQSIASGFYDHRQSSVILRNANRLKLENHLEEDLHCRSPSRPSANRRNERRGL